MLIDDSGQGEGHYENIFREDFYVLSCAKHKHHKYEWVTCINYAGDFKNENIMDTLVDRFLHEPAKFNNFPSDLKIKEST